MKTSGQFLFSRIFAALLVMLGPCSGDATAQQESGVTVQQISSPVASEKGLTLDESVLIALHNHGNVGVAAQNYVSARENITSARSGLYPQIDANIGYNYRTSNSSNGTTVINTQAGTTTGISVTQNVFDGGRTKAQVRQSQARALGAVGGVGSARNTLAYQVASAFFEQLRQEKLATQRQGQLALAQEQLKQIEAQIQAGTTAPVDAQSVRVNVSQAKFDLATAQNDLRTAETTFRNILGLPRGDALKLQETALALEATSTPPAAPLDEDATTSNPTVPAFPTATVEALPVVPELDTLEHYVQQARELRPDLLQVKAGVQQMQAVLDIAKISQKPQLTATAGYDIDPRSTGNRGLTFSAGISLPLFDAGGRKADVKAAQATLEANRIQLEQLDKDVAADVEATFVDIGGQVERITNARALVQQAQVNLQTTSERYRLGLGIVLDIVNAQTQLFNAQTSLTQAVYDYELAQSNLNRAVGRFAWADPGQTTPGTAPTTTPKILPIAATAVTSVMASAPTSVTLPVKP